VKPVNFSDPAAAELIAAIQWYEQRRISLGGELFDAVSATIELIRSHPDAGAPRRAPATTRQFKVHRFPYHVVYRVRDEDIYVVAIAHSKRRPDYWRDRR